MPWILHESISDDVDVSWIPPEDPRNERTRVLDGISNSRFSGDPTILPLHFRQDSNHKVFPDFMRGGRLGIVLVSRAFRDLIEDMDPGHSCYYPVVLHCSDGRVLEDAYFLHKFSDFIDDGIVVEESDVTPSVVRGVVRHYGSIALPKLVWRSEKITGRHIFADTHLAGRFCVSDAFLKAAEARGFGGFKKVKSFQK